MLNINSGTQLIADKFNLISYIQPFYIYELQFKNIRRYYDQRRDHQLTRRYNDLTLFCHAPIR